MIDSFNGLEARTFTAIRVNGIRMRNRSGIGCLPSRVTDTERREELMAAELSSFYVLSRRRGTGTVIGSFRMYFYFKPPLDAKLNVRLAELVLFTKTLQEYMVTLKKCNLLEIK